MYAFALFAHSTLRWLVLGLAVTVTVRSLLGWYHSRPWSAFDERVQLALVWSTRVQFLLGISLYLVLSPLTEVFLSNVRSALHVRELRFFGLEHALLMVIAVALIDSGRARSKRITEGRKRHRRVCIGTVIPLTLMLGAVPWPFMPTQRSWFRTPPLLLSSCQFNGQVPEAPES